MCVWRMQLALCTCAGGGGEGRGTARVERALKPPSNSGCTHAQVFLFSRRRAAAGCAIFGRKVVLANFESLLLDFF